MGLRCCSGQRLPPSTVDLEIRLFIFQKTLRSFGAVFYWLETDHMNSFQFGKLWLFLGWMLAALIVVLSLWPKPPELIGFEQSDKLTHIIAYSILMLWFANIYPQSSSRLRLSLGFFVMGVCLELLQGMTEYRQFSYIDMLANGVGILLALYLAKTRLATCLLHLDTYLDRLD